MNTDPLIQALTSNTDNFICMIHDQKYIFKPVFFNPDNNFTVLTKSAIKNIILSDNALNPFRSLNITVINNDNSFERLVESPHLKEFSDITSKKGYTFRGDGRDFFYFEIIPIEDTFNGTYEDLGEEYKEVYGIKNTYVCVKDEELKLDNDKDTYRQFTLMDVDEFLMRDKVSYFTSVKELPVDIDPTYAGDDDRKSFTGDCIRRVLQENLIYSNPGSLFEYEDGKISNFDKGSSKIFYTAPANNTGMDTLLELCDKHVSSKDSKDFCILKKQTYSGRYTLESMREVFNKAYISDGSKDMAGAYNFEKVHITGTTSESISDITKAQSKTPELIPNFGEKSNVLEYKFFNTDSIVNAEKLRSTMVHSYNHSDKTFNIDYSQSNIKAARETFSKYYVEPMKGKEPYPNMVFNETKSENYNIYNVFSTLHNAEDKIARLSQGLNKILKNAIMTNIGVELLLPGITFRQANRFLSLERKGNYIDNNFDKKLLGIYYILHVDHIFEGDVNYYNKIIAVKTYHFENPNYIESTG